MYLMFPRCPGRTVLTFPDASPATTGAVPVMPWTTTAGRFNVKDADNEDDNVDDAEVVIKENRGRSNCMFTVTAGSK